MLRREREKGKVRAKLGWLSCYYTINVTAYLASASVVPNLGNINVTVTHSADGDKRNRPEAANRLWLCAIDTAIDIGVAGAVVRGCCQLVEWRGGGIERLGGAEG